MRKLIYTTLIVTIMLCLAACGKKTKTEAEVEKGILSKTEEEIEKDIISEYTYLEECQGLESYSFEVTLRKTDSKNGTDEVQCLITVDNEYMTYKRNFIVEYYLYDNAENSYYVRKGTTSNIIEVKPSKTTITLEQAQKDFEYMMPQYGFGLEGCTFLREKVELENRGHSFIFTDTHYEYEVRYSFDIYDVKWKFSYFGFERIE